MESFILKSLTGYCQIPVSAPAICRNFEGILLIAGALFLAIRLL